MVPASVTSTGARPTASQVAGASSNAYTPRKSGRRSRRRGTPGCGRRGVVHERHVSRRRDLSLHVRGSAVPDQRLQRRPDNGTSEPARDGGLVTDVAARREPRGLGHRGSTPAALCRTSDGPQGSPASCAKLRREGPGRPRRSGLWRADCVVKHLQSGLALTC